MTTDDEPKQVPMYEWLETRQAQRKKAASGQMWTTIAVILVVLGIAGYFAYVHIRETPSDDLLAQGFGLSIPFVVLFFVWLAARRKKRR